LGGGVAPFTSNAISARFVETLNGTPCALLTILATGSIGGGSGGVVLSHLAVDALVKAEPFHATPFAGLAIVALRNLINAQRGTPLSSSAGGASDGIGCRTNTIVAYFVVPSAGRAREALGLVDRI